MFKVYSDFAAVAPAQHPGQPVHSEPGFDIWQGSGHVYLIQTDGQKLEFPTVAAATIAAHDLIKSTATPPPAAPAK